MKKCVIQIVFKPPLMLGVIFRNFEYFRSWSSGYHFTSCLYILLNESHLESRVSFFHARAYIQAVAFRVNRPICQNVTNLFYMSPNCTLLAGADPVFTIPVTIRTNYQLCKFSCFYFCDYKQDDNVPANDQIMIKAKPKERHPRSRRLLWPSG